MTREELIAYIKENDRKFNHHHLNFNYFSDEELLFLKKRIDEENKKEDEKGKK